MHCAVELIGTLPEAAAALDENGLPTQQWHHVLAHGDTVTLPLTVYAYGQLQFRPA